MSLKKRFGSAENGKEKVDEDGKKKKKKGIEKCRKILYCLASLTALLRGKWTEA